MATSSISANFKISDPDAARALVDGVTNFDKAKAPKLPHVRGRVLHRAADIRKFFGRKAAAK